MTTAGLITMVLVQVTVTLVTVYFFWKVLRVPPKSDDSYTEEG